MIFFFKTDQKCQHLKIKLKVANIKYKGPKVSCGEIIKHKKFAEYVFVFQNGPIV